MPFAALFYLCSFVKNILPYTNREKSKYRISGQKIEQGNKKQKKSNVRIMLWKTTWRSMSKNTTCSTQLMALGGSCG